MVSFYAIHVSSLDKNVQLSRVTHTHLPYKPGEKDNQQSLKEAMQNITICQWRADQSCVEENN